MSGAPQRRLAAPLVHCARSSWRHERFHRAQHRGPRPTCEASCLPRLVVALSASRDSGAPHVPRGTTSRLCDRAMHRPTRSRQPPRDARMRRPRRRGSARSPPRTTTAISTSQAQVPAPSPAGQGPDPGRSMRDPSRHGPPSRRPGTRRTVAARSLVAGADAARRAPIDAPRGANASGPNHRSFRSVLTWGNATDSLLCEDERDAYTEPFGLWTSESPLRTTLLAWSTRHDDAGRSPVCRRGRATGASRAWSRTRGGGREGAGGSPRTRARAPGR